MNSRFEIHVSRHPSIEILCVLKRVTKCLELPFNPFKQEISRFLKPKKLAKMLFAFQGILLSARANTTKNPATTAVSRPRVLFYFLWNINFPSWYYLVPCREPKVVLYTMPARFFVAHAVESELAFFKSPRFCILLKFKICNPIKRLGRHVGKF